MISNWMPQLLLALQAGRPQVLVTVIQTKGSVPRDVGARMWVGDARSSDTIGGGHLEWQAIAHARNLLAAGQPVREVIRYALGPSLGQCCGGVVWLAFEYLNQNDIFWCQTVLQGIQANTSIQRSVFLGSDTAQSVQVAQAASGVASHWDADSKTMLDVWPMPAMHIVLCGAGHVGHAISTILMTLPVQLSWLDPRDDVWPDEVAANVRCIQGDADDVVDLPDDAYWLVLTHSHALDMQIIKAILSQRRFAFLGLIGSQTKKAKFMSQLSRQFSPDLLARLQCPIGLLNTTSKEPAVIAVSVVAQLLSLRGQ